jgi:hypothetical protein
MAASAKMASNDASAVNLNSSAIESGAALVLNVLPIMI